MKAKFPNTSILSIITQTKAEKEVILHFYLKIVPDYTEGNSIYWFDNKGKNGKANFIWQELSLKQWLATGNDEDIQALLNQILNEKEITISSKKNKFVIPEYFKKDYEGQSVESRYELKHDSYMLKDISVLPQQFFNEENLKILSGYKITDTTIKPLYPVGLYEKNFLYDKLKEKIFGIVEHRQPYLTFRGVHETSVKGKGSKEIIGFYQEKFDLNKDYSVIVFDEDGDKLGEDKINKKNGVFKISLTKHVIKGKVIVKEDYEVGKSIDFVLLQEIRIDINVADKTYEDIYARKFMIGHKTTSRPKSIKSFSWIANSYSPAIEGYKKLSDKFRDIFHYLGESILIADPYFIGQIKQNETTNEFILTECQKAFVNAITHYSLENKFSDLIILGISSRANQHFDKEDQSKTKKEQRFESYEKFLKNFVKQNNLQEYFPRITFKNAISDFHNRYWFSIKKEGDKIILEKCVIATNSLGNMKEVDFVPVTEKEQISLLTFRFIKLLNDSQTEMEICYE